MKLNEPRSRSLRPKSLLRGLWIFGLLAPIILTGSAAASEIFDIYVLRKGDGVEVTGAMQAHHIDHFSVINGGSMELVESRAAPDEDPGTRITQGGDFSTYSQLTQSVDGDYLTFMGRSAELGGSGGETDHVVGIFDLEAGTFDTSTRVVADDLDQRGGRGFRGGITTDGNDIWFTGRNQRAWYTTRGSTTAQDIGQNWQYNLIGIHEGDLYISRRAGSTHGLHRWDGLPTEEPTDEAARLADLGTGWDNDNGQYGDFAFVGDYLFVTTTHHGMADHIAVFENDGPDVWNWMEGPRQALFDTIEGVPHLAAAVDRDDYVQLVYTNEGGGEDNSLYSVIWDLETETFGTPVHLADAGTGYTFAGVVGVPVETDEVVPLTLASEHAGTDPEAGIYGFAPGTEITATAPEEVALPGGLLSQVTGWTGTGSVPAEGTGDSVTFTLNEASTLEWQWETLAAPAEPLVEYDLTGSTGDTQPATGFADGINPLEITVGPGVNPSGLANGFSSNGWAPRDSFDRETAINNGDYLQFGFEVEEGRAFLTTLDTALRRSAFNGPMFFEWQYSLDGFATEGVTIVPNGEIWDNIDWEPEASYVHGTDTFEWADGVFVYRGRNSGGPDRSVVIDYNYMTRDVTMQGANNVPGNPIPTIDLRGIPDLQGVPAGTTVTFRLYAWGNESTTDTNSLAFGRFDGPAVGGAVVGDDQLPLTVISDRPDTDPLPGIHRFPENSEITASAAEEVLEGEDVRHNLEGWKRSSGAVPPEGDDESITFTLNDPTTLDWRWLTEHRLSVGAEGNGAVGVQRTIPVPVLGFNFAPYTREDSLNQDEVGVPASTVDDRLEPSTIMRGSGILSRNLAPGGMSSDNWNGTPSFDSAVAQDKYLEFNVTPASGQSVDLHSIFIPYRYSQTAAHSIALVYSFDNFETFTMVESLRIQDQASGTQVDRHLFLLPEDERLQDMTEEVRFRIYGWGGTGAGSGTFALFNERGAFLDDMFVFGGASESSSVVGNGSEEFWFALEAHIRAEAQPAADSVFTGWSGGFFNNNPVLSGLTMSRPLGFTGNFATDSDGDGIPDFWKERFFGDIDNPDAAAGEDPDGDGADNLEEYLRGTDPTVPDELLAGDTIPFSPWENVQRDPEVPGNWVVEDFGDGFIGAWESSNDNRSALDPFRADGESVQAVAEVSFEGPRLILRDVVWEEEWKDATLETIISVGDDDGNMLYFRYQDELNWYRVTISGESNGSSRPDIGVSVQKRVDGEYTELVPPDLAIATDPTDTDWFKRIRVRVEQDGADFTIRIEGWDVFLDPPDWNPDFVFEETITDTDHEYGRAGIGTWAQGGFPDSADWNPVDAGALFETFTVTMDDSVVYDQDWEALPQGDELPANWDNAFAGTGFEGNWRMSAHGTIAQMSAVGAPTSGTEETPAADADGPVLLAPSIDDASTYVLNMGFHPFRTGASGFVFDYIDEDNFGRVLFSNVLGEVAQSVPSGVVVSRKIDGVWTDLFIGDRTFVYDLAQPFHVTFSRAGENYVMTVQEIDNSEPIYRWDWEDGSAPGTTGRHGFASWQTDNSHFLYSDVFGVLTVPGEGLEVTGIEVGVGTITLQVENLPSTEPYNVQRTTDLNAGDWQTVDTNQTGSTWTGEVPEGEDRVFWRLVRVAD